MDIEETMVDEELDETADDTPEEIVEEEQDESESLDSLTDGEDGQAPAEEPQEEAPQATEPGWIKKRVEKAVTKAIAETEARMQAMFDQQMAPIREKMIEDEAQELVRSRKVTDIETARELVRFRKGQPQTQPVQQPQQAPQQPRQSNGQFAPRTDVATKTQIDMLQHQADRIAASGGPDVIKEFQTNKEIQMKVVSGEMDFYEVADYLKEKSSRKRPPSPMRSPNGASGTNPNAIDSMSDEQFEKMERRIKEGARYTLK